MGLARPFFVVFDTGLNGMLVPCPVAPCDAALQIPYLDTAKDSLFVRSSSYKKMYVGGMASVALPLDFSGPTQEAS